MNTHGDQKDWDIQVGLAARERKEVWKNMDRESLGYALSWNSQEG